MANLIEKLTAGGQGESAGMLTARPCGSHED